MNVLHYPCIGGGVWYSGSFVLHRAIRYVSIGLGVAAFSSAARPARADQKQATLAVTAVVLPACSVQEQPRTGTAAESVAITCSKAAAQTVRAHVEGRSDTATVTRSQGDRVQVHIDRHESSGEILLTLQF